MKQIIDGLKYDTETAIEIASDFYWDGHNYERQGRNKHLYKTQNGRFFLMHTTLFEGERDYIEPIDKEQAKYEYEHFLPEHDVEWEEAFDEQPKEA